MYSWGPGPYERTKPCLSDSERSSPEIFFCSSFQFYRFQGSYIRNTEINQLSRKLRPGGNRMQKYKPMTSAPRPVRRRLRRRKRRSRRSWKAHLRGGLCPRSACSATRTPGLTSGKTSQRFRAAGCWTSSSRKRLNCRR